MHRTALLAAVALALMAAVVTLRWHEPAVVPPAESPPARPAPSPAPPAPAEPDAAGPGSAHTLPGHSGRLRQLEQQLQPAFSRGRCTPLIAELGELVEVTAPPTTDWRQATRLLAGCLDAMLELDQVRALYEAAAADDRDHAWWKLRLASLYWRDRRHDEAAALLLRALELEESAEAFLLLAAVNRHRAEVETDAAQRSRLLDQAEAGLRRASELDRLQAAAVLHDLALLLEGRGRTEGALQAMHAALDALYTYPESPLSNPENVAGMYVALGEIYYRSGQRDVGIAYMNQGIDLTPDPAYRDSLRQRRDRALGNAAP